MAILGSLVAGSLRAEEQTSPVVFVCEHGSVKSMIAAQWFNRLSAERGLRLRAVSRGVEPDQTIPAGVAENLRKDGFELRGLLPARLQKHDLSRAAHVVVIGARSPLLDGLAAAPERWDDIPPASTNYEASRDAIRQRIGALLDKLAPGQGIEKRPSRGRSLR